MDLRQSGGKQHNAFHILIITLSLHFRVHTHMHHSLVNVHMPDKHGEIPKPTSIWWQALEIIMLLPVIDHDACLVNNATSMYNIFCGMVPIVAASRHQFQTY